MNSSTLVMRLLAACLLAAALSAVAAARAQAGEYVVVGCADLDGASTRPATGWYLTAGRYPSRNDCPKRDGLYAANGDKPNLFRFDAPAGTTISRLVTTYRAHLSAATSSALPVLVAEAWHSGGWAPIPPAFTHLGSSPIDVSGWGAAGEARRATALRIGVRCDRGHCTSGGQPRARFYALGVVLDDSVAPSAGVGAPARAAAGIPVTVMARDTGGGVYRRELELDGRRIAADPLCATIRASFGTTARHVTSGVPCPRDASATIALDTTAFEDGEHALGVRVEDVAGNVRRAATPLVIDNQPPRAGTVTLAGDPAEALTARPAGFDGQGVAYEYRWERCGDEGCAEIGGASGEAYRTRPRDAGLRLRAVVSASDGGGSVQVASAPSEVVPAPAPAARAARPASRLTAWLQRGQRRLRRATVSWPAAVRVRGRLTDVTGRPLAGTRVRALERVAGRGWRRLADARTDDAGRLALRTRVGPTRDLRLTHGRSVVTLHITVRAAVRVRLQRRGTLALLTGQVRGGHVPASGLRLRIQSRDPSGWRTRATLRTDGAGLFSATGNAPRGARLRVVVPPQRGYPFARGVGAP